MASKTVQPIAIKLGIEGGEKLAALNRSFRDLSKQVKLSDADIAQATKDIVKFATEAGNSEATIKGQIKAFEGLREQAALGGKAYTELTQGISKLQSTLRGSSDAVERERSNLVKLGSASKNSAKDLQYVISQLEKLKSKVREDSAAFLQLGKDIKNLNVNLKEVEISAGKARFAINTILSAKPEKITGQIEKLNAAIASGTLEAEDLNVALRKLELLRVGAGRGPVAFRADVFSSQLGVDYFARLRKEYGNLEKTQAAITQRISEVNTELQNVSGYERRRSLTLELIRLNKELQQSIVNVTTREQFQAMAIRQRMGSARESYAASGFGAFSAEMRQRTAGGEFTPGMQRARERARNEIINEEAVRATTDIFDTWEQAYGRIEDAARDHKTEMARIQAAQGQLLIEKQDRINDELLRSNQAAYDKEVAAFDARLNRIEKLKSGEFVSRQALGLGGGELSSLYGNIVGIGTSYARGQQEMMGRSPIQVFNDIASTFNRDLRRSGDARIEAERQLRDNLVREFGAGSQRLKAALERIPMGQMTTAQLPGAGEDLSAYVRRIEASTRGLEGVLTGFGKKTTNELRQARQSLVLFRDELDPTTASFKKLEKEAVASISRIDKELERRQMGRRRGMSPMQMTQAAGAAISGGIFGGPEGFLGGAIGAIGGVGGAFAGAAIGAQVGGLRRQLGEFADYAAGIQRLQIALKGVAGSQSEFNKALLAARNATDSLNVPQETAIQGITRLTAAVKGAGGNVGDASLAFRNISSAIIATGGGAEQVEGAITALVQIFSKGKVSMEEINQIAERLPGTFNTFAKAAGMTGPEMLKALQQGKVGLNDLMSFLIEVGNRYNATASSVADSSQSAGARLQVAFNDMRIAVGEALQPIGAEFQSIFTNFIEDITPAMVAVLPKIGEVALALAKNLDVLAISAGTAFAAMGVAKIAAIGGLSAALLKLAAAAGTASVALKGTAAAALLNPWVALAAGISAATVGIYKYYEGQKELNALLDDGAGSTQVIKDKILEYEDSIRKATEKLKGINGEQKATGRDAQRLKKEIIELKGELDRLKGTYKIRIEYEQKGYKFGEGGAMEEFTVGDIVYGGPAGARARPLRRVDGTPLDGVTDYKGPTVDTADSDGKKAARDAERRAEEIARLKRAYDLQFAKRQILTVDMQLLDVARFIDQAQKESNAEAVDALRRKQSDLVFEKDLLAAKIEYDGTAREIRETLEGQQRVTAELKAEDKLRQSINVALGQQMSRILTIEQDITYEKKKQRRAIEAELTDRKRALGLISDDEYNAALMERESRRLREQFPREAQAPQRAELLDLYRQEIDPTPFESMRQNITQLKDELRELVDPINQITGAATAIGDAFSKAFVDAISGASTAKEALASFFQSVGSYFLDMAKQIIAKMIQIAILNSVAKLLPGSPGGFSLGGTPFGAGGGEVGGIGTLGPNFGIAQRASGGPVTPGNTYMVGERGPELLTMTPSGGYVTSNSASQAAMDRYSSGNTRGGSISVNYNVTEINGMKFVTEDQFRAGISQAAKQGAEGGFNRTMTSLKNSRSTRSRVGV